VSTPATRVEPPLVEARVAVPDAESARRIATDLVGRQLAACVQVLGPMMSVYTWQDEVHHNEEWLLLAKTTADTFPALAQAVAAQHRYDVPEIIAVPVSQALSSYATWVRQGSDGIDDKELAGG
jgi:periplasmic divalent cation tolerance protein